LVGQFVSAQERDAVLDAGALRRRCPVYELESTAPDPPLTQPGRRHHLEHHRHLVGGPMDRGGRKEADVMGMPKVLHQLMNEVTRRRRTGYPILSWHRYPAALGDPDQLARGACAFEARRHRRSGNAKNPGDLRC